MVREVVDNAEGGSHSLPSNFFSDEKFLRFCYLMLKLKDIFTARNQIAISTDYHYVRLSVHMIDISLN